MISELIRSGFDRALLVQVLLSVPIILLALSMHECAHGFVAKLMGDPTAYNLGRLTLNPTKHLDFFGTLMMLLFGFGWAKPVPINTRHFKNPKWGMALSALAGPVSNLIASYIFYMLSLVIANFTSANAAYVSMIYGGGSDSGSFIWLSLYLLCSVGFSLNLSLAIFNLLPMPPLDGSRILFVFLPSKAYFAVMKYERYISIVIMVLLFTNILDIPLGFVMEKIVLLYEMSARLVGLI